MHLTFLVLAAAQLLQTVQGPPTTNAVDLTNLLSDSAKAIYSDYLASPFDNYTSLYIDGQASPEVIPQARAALKNRCAEQKAKCRIPVIRSGDRLLAEMDMEGNWIEYGSKQEIADVIVMALQPHQPEKPKEPATK